MRQFEEHTDPTEVSTSRPEMMDPAFAEVTAALIAMLTERGWPCVRDVDPTPQRDGAQDSRELIFASPDDAWSLALHCETLLTPAQRQRAERRGPFLVTPAALLVKWELETRAWKRDNPTSPTDDREFRVSPEPEEWYGSDGAGYMHFAWYPYPADYPYTPEEYEAGFQNGREYVGGVRGPHLVALAERLQATHGWAAAVAAAEPSDVHLRESYDPREPVRFLPDTLTRLHIPDSDAYAAIVAEAEAEDIPCALLVETAWRRWALAHDPATAD